MLIAPLSKSIAETVVSYFTDIGGIIFDPDQRTFKMIEEG